MNAIPIQHALPAGIAVGPPSNVGTVPGIALHQTVQGISTTTTRPIPPSLITTHAAHLMGAGPGATPAAVRYAAGLPETVLAVAATHRPPRDIVPPNVLGMNNLADAVIGIARTLGDEAAFIAEFRRQFPDVELPFWPWKKMDFAEGHIRGIMMDTIGFAMRLRGADQFPASGEFPLAEITRIYEREVAFLRFLQSTETTAWPQNLANWTDAAGSAVLHDVDHRRGQFRYSKASLSKGNLWLLNFLEGAPIFNADARTRYAKLINGATTDEEIGAAIDLLFPIDARLKALTMRFAQAPERLARIASAYGVQNASTEQFYQTLNLIVDRPIYPSDEAGLIVELRSIGDKTNILADERGRAMKKFIAATALSGLYATAPLYSFEMEAEDIYVFWRLLTSNSFLSERYRFGILVALDMRISNMAQIFDNVRGAVGTLLRRDARLGQSITDQNVLRYFIGDIPADAIVSARPMGRAPIHEGMPSRGPRSQRPAAAAPRNPLLVSDRPISVAQFRDAYGSFRIKRKLPTGGIDIAWDRDTLREVIGRMSPDARAWAISFARYGGVQHQHFKGALDKGEIRGFRACLWHLLIETGHIEAGGGPTES